LLLNIKESRRVLSRTQGTSENTPFDFWSCGWKNLSIQYKVKYPMEAFFSENCKQRYNDIFHLLIVLRYVLLEQKKYLLLYDKECCLEADAIT
jgi:hypothetical protein